MSYPKLDQASEKSLAQINVSSWPVRPIVVLIVDDHALIQAAIGDILTPCPEVKRIFAAQNYPDAEEKVAQFHPDIIFLDIHIAYSDGIAEIRRLRKLSPDSRILALADVEEEQEAFATIMAGAQGYYSKQDINPDDIVTLINRICLGEFVLRPILLAHLMERLLRAAALPLRGSENEPAYRVLLPETDFQGLAELTTREREVLQLISQGYRDRDIAEKLRISEKTVQKHVQSILVKLGAQNRTEAAYFIHRHQSIP